MSNFNEKGIKCYNYSFKVKSGNYIYLLRYRTRKCRVLISIIQTNLIKI